MEGLIFEYATWRRPGNAEGFVEQQSAACDDCPAGTKAGVGCGANDTYLITPGNVAVLGSKDVSFHNCVRPTLLQAPFMILCLSSIRLDPTVRWADGVVATDLPPSWSLRHIRRRGLAANRMARLHVRGRERWLAHARRHH